MHSHRCSLAHVRRRPAPSMNSLWMGTCICCWDAIIPAFMADAVRSVLVMASSTAENGLATKVEKSRKQMKERKNRAKKIRGVKKTKAGDAAKSGKKK